ncbi:hypothetical protein SKAU_G00136400 [Synaphobranchus kaupii]|uniref:Reverse transcriptase domain-containing protein n=1 Tax=Synaphobranchus kaupii TaxID=118154 RepID=A0A9Q1FRN2_SYNKA|nr:hypothetical protein SKAU_G00136400 [Synaphobranchus kaupii]
MPSLHSLNISSFEYHAITVTHPSKLNIVVLYRPPGPLSAFLDELDTLLSSFPEDGTPIILLGDFNLQPDSSQSSSVASLLQSLALTQSPSPATHKAGNQLDLVFTRSCATSELTVTPLHTLEDTDVLQLVTRQRATTCPLDPIPSAVLQSISGEVLPYLSSIFNTSLTCGYVPAVFKTARVTPLLKKPSLDPSDVRNYHPVSLLPFLSKALERAALNQLSVFHHQNNLLNPHQSGFRTGHSTETALLAVTEALVTARASSLSSVLILLDLSAVFDTVNHKLLISILAEMGISGTALSWFTSYLIDPTKSPGRALSLHLIHFLQESRRDLYWGPLLFSIYTKSLGLVINSHGFSYHSYADDTQLFLSLPPSAPQVKERISACLADISEWMSSHHLKFNLDKTKLLFMPYKTSPLLDLSITVDGTMVTASHSARNLGVVLDDQLDFKEHIRAMAPEKREFGRT